MKSILRKKIYPQNATAIPTDKYLQRKHQDKLSIEEAAAQEKGDDGEKWVKTDSECKCHTQNVHSELNFSFVLYFCLSLSFFVFTLQILFLRSRFHL